MQSSIKTVIYKVDVDLVEQITVPVGFRQMTLTTQPLTLQGDPSGEDLRKQIDTWVSEVNAVLPDSMAGTVTFKATPPRTFYAYDIPDGVVDLSAPSFVSTDIPIDYITVETTGLTGSTHLAITISSYL